MLNVAAPRSARPFTGGRVAPRFVATRAIKLYTNPGSRGKIAEWYLGELGLKYETVLLNMRAGEHKKPEYLAINPFGKVPGLEDGDLKLFESGAILLHLANKYGKLEVDAFAKAAQWTLFANSTLSESFFGQGRSGMGGMLSQLDSMLSSKEHLEGSFAVGDVAVGSYLLYLPLFFPDMFTPGGFSTKYPNVWRYMQRLAARPACPAPYKEALAQAEASSAPAGSGGILGGLFGGKK